MSEANNLTAGGETHISIGAADSMDSPTFTVPNRKFELAIKPRKWRCPKGHEWGDLAEYDQLRFTQGDVPHRSGPNCPICLVEFFRQFPAEEIK